MPRRLCDAAGGGGAQRAPAEQASHVCALTWMCREHNLHPIDEGYRDIADAIAAVISLPPTIVP